MQRAKHTMMANARPGRSRPAHTRRGLTLIEVMIAMAIIGIGIVVLVTAAARCIGVVRQSKNYHMARAILDRGEAEHPIIKDKETKDLINLDVEPVLYDNGFTFTRKAEESDEEGLILLRSTVSWSERSRSAQEEVVTYLFYTNALK